MSAQDKIEKILRSLHVLLSKSEPYQKDTAKVVVDKQEMLALLSELNKSMYDIISLNCVRLSKKESDAR